MALGFQGHLPSLYLLLILLLFLVSIQAFARNPLPSSVGIPDPLLTARMLPLYLFIALALLGLSLPANTAPSPQLTELGDSFVMNDNNIIPFDPSYYIPINPYTPTNPVLNQPHIRF